MSIWTNFLTESLGGVIDSVGDAIDKLVTSDEEKLAMRNELVKLQLQYNTELQNRTMELEKEVSKRWISDNEHWLTRLVRPAVVAWLFFLFTVVMLFDGNVWEFRINPSYIPMLETTLQTVIVAYFSGRSIEKGIKIHNEYRRGATDEF